MVLVIFCAIFCNFFALLFYIIVKSFLLNHHCCFIHFVFAYQFILIYLWILHSCRLPSADFTFVLDILHFFYTWSVFRFDIYFQWCLVSCGNCFWIEESNAKKWWIGLEWLLLCERLALARKYLIPFHVNSLLLYPLERSQNLWFSNIFRGYRKRPVT